MTTKSDDTNFHVGAFHQFRNTDDGFVIRSTFVAPGDSPKAVAEGHKIHFPLEIVNSMKIAYAQKQADAAAEKNLASFDMGWAADMSSGTVKTIGWLEIIGFLAI